MTNFRDPELLAKIRQQFDNCPYPNIPLEQSYEKDIDWLYLHNLTTPYYLRNQRVITTQEKYILDAGCGSGYKSLGLAQANPGAKIIGVDLSPTSIELARKRLSYHGFNEVEFHALGIEEIEQLNCKFDYINCDEVLYLVPDPLRALNAMKSVLKPDGILRFNLHSRHSRVRIFRMQEAFKLMGLMETNSGELELEAVRELMDSLKDTTISKYETWGDRPGTVGRDESSILANYLLAGDKGFSIPEIFDYLRQAELEFIRMFEGHKWNLYSLFKDADNLPVFLGLSLPETSEEEQLYLYELLNPANRLLDLWCGHPHQSQPWLSPSEWNKQEWQGAIVHLHPQLKIQIFREELFQCLEHLHPFDIHKFLPENGEPIALDSTISACLLLPLLEGSQSVAHLVQRWQKLYPIHPVTLHPIELQDAWQIISQAIVGLVESGYLLLEKSL